MYEPTYIQSIVTEDTGGGIELDVLELRDGTLLVIGEESIVMYSNRSAWEANNPAGVLGMLVRPDLSDGT